MEMWGGDGVDEDEEDLIDEALLAATSVLSRTDYDVDAIVDETYLDLDQIVRFLAETQKFEPKHDDKLNKLKRLLASKDLAGQKVHRLHRVRRHGPVSGTRARAMRA